MSETVAVARPVETAAEVEEFTEWCYSPTDHCINGTCPYGDHGPVTQAAEDLIRAAGYGSYLDDEEADE